MGWPVFFLSFYESHTFILFRTPIAIIDLDDRVMTILAGRPHRQDWDQVHARMSALLEQAGTNAHGLRKERRGKFVSISAGVSYGGGQTVSLVIAVSVLLSHASRLPAILFIGRPTMQSSTAYARMVALYVPLDL